MQIETLQFGVLDIDENTIITFPDGLPGFEECTQFKLLHDESPAPRVMWMQSVNGPDVVLNVIDASLLGFNYQLSLTDEESAKIDCKDTKDIVLLLTLAKDSGTGKITPHTSSPIVLNTATRKAIQKSGVRAVMVFTNA
ncbi:MAG: flagellar assembly protein FliW [Burkholderiales bacterium]|nr:flagellar assembly protein FliW [Burkholderiales bacterium]